MQKDLIKKVVVVLMVALSWVITYQLNILLFRNASISPMVSWIFLPAGIKIISVIVFDKLGVLGLFLVHLQPITLMVLMSAHR